jgi:dihydrodipicolinate synthase/N-acetylneuraminate lyase
MIIKSDLTEFDAISMLRPNRKLTGISAILLPFNEDGQADWEGFRAHVARTADAGLIPAVNMDTGYVNLLDDNTRLLALNHARDILGGRAFVAGAFVGDAPGSELNLDAYQRAADEVQRYGATPVIFQSHGLTSLDPVALLEAYRTIGRNCPQFIAFELGTMFAPFGKIYDLDTYAGLMSIEACVGAKHSSLSRMEEWKRIQLRDRVRLNFKVFTGNDLAIDMVMYGSDYLLGLSTFAPDLFAQRDAYWASGSPKFYELNDLLQYLGHFAFRVPVPAYKHSAAQFLKLRGWIRSDAPHPMAARRPQSDIAVLEAILERMQELEP